MPVTKAYQGLNKKAPALSESTLVAKSVGFTPTAKDLTAEFVRCYISLSLSFILCSKIIMDVIARLIYEYLGVVMDGGTHSVHK